MTLLATMADSYVRIFKLVVIVRTFAHLTGKNACATIKLIDTGFGGTDIPVCELQKHILRKS
ncbi:MAG: hypothetical protein EAZ92_06510 [Candidatus Kapaibacterium sp.]|nr:MAG: hypothetical protein EAZ92_06510 [Candidatus Kapabacteria bacterium]